MTDFDTPTNTLDLFIDDIDDIDEHVAEHYSSADDSEVWEFANDISELSIR